MIGVRVWRVSVEVRKVKCSTGVNGGFCGQPCILYRPSFGGKGLIQSLDFACMEICLVFEGKVLTQSLHSTYSTWKCINPVA
jgi:hypothetical protein